MRKSATRVAQARNLRCALGAFDQYSDTYSEEVDRALERLGDSELFTEITDDAIVDAAAEAIGPPNEIRAFDVGCGPGLTDALLADRFASITGVDIAPAMIERASALNPSATYEVYDGARLPFESASFDVAFAICVFVGKPARSQLAAKMGRVTRIGSLVAILEHNQLNPLTRVVVARCEFDEDVDLVRGLESTRLLAAAGAQPITTRYLAFFPWCGKLLRRAERLALLAAASRMLPLPLYPDQLARLRARKPADSAAARLELAFRPRPLPDGLADVTRAT